MRMFRGWAMLALCLVLGVAAGTGSETLFAVDDPCAELNRQAPDCGYTYDPFRQCCIPSHPICVLMPCLGPH